MNVQSDGEIQRRHSRRIRRLTPALLLASVALPVHASSSATAEAAQAGAGGQQPEEIVVIGQSLFRDLQPERQLDEEGIASYGLSTIDELLAEVQGELGEDEEPLILVNGQRIFDPAEIGTLPVEALRDLQVLPRGSAVRAGGRSNQRVVSLVLKKNTKTATVLLAPKVATEGDWHGARGEAILTRVRGSTRANITLRARHDDALLESDRGIIQRELRAPFALDGNVIGYPNLSGEIDPLLSAAAGQIVTVSPVVGGANPDLGDFVDGANDAAVTDLGDFRTLRPRNRNYDLTGTFSTRVTSWLTSTATFRLSRGLSDSRRGLPTGLFILGDENPASPFSRDVALAFLGRDPLHSRSRRDSGEGNLTLNGQFGRWTGNFNAQHSIGKIVTNTERQTTSGFIPIDDSTNPFGSDLADLIAIRTDRTSTRTVSSLAELSFTGPVASLPAGAIQATIEGRLARNTLRSESTYFTPFGTGRFSRSEQSIRGAVDVPLTSRANNVLGAIGDLSATAEVSRLHYSDAGAADYHAFGLNWQPIVPLRLRAEVEKTERPAAIQTLGDAVIETPDVRLFDPLTGETVDVVQIVGGNPSLLPETRTIRRLSGLLRLVPRLNLQLNAEYTDTDARNFISSLPSASAAVMLAFPDRFIRDGNGVLTTVDLRAVNFDSHREKRLRWGFNMNARLGGGPAPGGAAKPASGGAARPAPGARRAPVRQPPYLQLTANHTIVFSDEIVIRPDLDSVDLLKGGAIGIGGGRMRHQMDGTAGITSGGLGARLGVTWRGKSTLQSRVSGVTDRLRFSPLLLVDLRAFADMRRLFPRSDLAKSLRVSLNILNLTNDRQKVRDSFGTTPLQYQPGYREPVGRTIEIELRKVF